jgi:hypothetical protein
MNLRSTVAFGKFSQVVGKSLALGQWQVFMLEPAIGCGHSGSHTMKYVQGAIDEIWGFFRERLMFSMLLDAQSRFQLREDAILTMTDASGRYESWNLRLEHANRLLVLVEREIESRKVGKKAQKISDRTLERFLALGGILREFALFCKSVNIVLTRKLQLFAPDPVINEMVFLHLFHQRFSLALKMSHRKANSLLSVMAILAETLSIGDGNIIQEFLPDMGESLR